MSWHLGRLVAFDTESTGLDVEADRIVTASIVVIDPEVKPAPTVTTYLINPGVEIPESASKVHGITTEHAAEHGKPPADVLHDIVCVLGMYCQDTPLVGMNVAYDLTLLDRECRRHGVDTLSGRLALERGNGDDRIRPVIDVMVLDKAADRYRPGKKRLENLCETYGVKLDGAHDASFDALAAARVAWRMGWMSQLPVGDLVSVLADRRRPHGVASAWSQIGQMGLYELHDAQVRWYAEQSENFAQYLRQQANQARHRADVAADDEERATAEQEAAELDARVDTVSTEWPIRGAR